MKEEELITLLILSDHNHLFVLVTYPLIMFLDATKNIGSCRVPLPLFLESKMHFIYNIES